MKVFVVFLCALSAGRTGFVVPKVHEEGASVLYRTEDGLGNYQFGYDEKHRTGGSFRKEKGDGYGRKVGSYGLHDADGRVRVVNYVADEHGFRASVETNEPGVAPEDPAATAINKAPVAIPYPAPMHLDHLTGVNAALAHPVAAPVVGTYSAPIHSAPVVAPAGFYRQPMHFASVLGPSVSHMIGQMPAYIGHYLASQAVHPLHKAVAYDAPIAAAPAVGVVTPAVYAAPAAYVAPTAIASETYAAPAVPAAPVVYKAPIHFSDVVGPSVNHMHQNVHQHLAAQKFYKSLHSPAIIYETAPVVTRLGVAPAASAAAVAAPVVQKSLAYAAAPVAAAPVPVAAAAPVAVAAAAPIAVAAAPIPVAAPVPVDTAAAPEPVAAAAPEPVAAVSVPVAAAPEPVAAVSVPVAAAPVPVARPCTVAAAPVPVAAAPVPVAAAPVPVAAAPVPVAAAPVPVAAAPVPVAAGPVPVAATAVKQKVYAPYAAAQLPASVSAPVVKQAYASPVAGSAAYAAPVSAAPVVKTHGFASYAAAPLPVPIAVPVGNVDPVLEKGYVSYADAPVSVAAPIAEKAYGAAYAAPYAAKPIVEKTYAGSVVAPAGYAAPVSVAPVAPVIEKSFAYSRPTPILSKPYGTAIASAPIAAGPIIQQQYSYKTATPLAAAGPIASKSYAAYAAPVDAPSVIVVEKAHASYATASTATTPIGTPVTKAVVGPTIAYGPAHAGAEYGYTPAATYSAAPVGKLTVAYNGPPSRFAVAQAYTTPVYAPAPVATKLTASPSYSYGPLTVEATIAKPVVYATSGVSVDPVVDKHLAAGVPTTIATAPIATAVHQPSIAAPAIAAPISKVGLEHGAVENGIFKTAAGVNGYSHELVKPHAYTKVYQWMYGHSPSFYGYAYSSVPIGYRKK
ncbi:calphotin-like isoform X2 [Varroa destructor]|uniref:Uncharacterized protein n=1 Tax=Varroa destructor TaxID=109461 RepID=A0A7M7JBE9_VARDE|nr:calphotin-like isoform X2 [Varroa destructor]